MYVRPNHHPRDRSEVVEFMRRHMFATLVTGGIASHLPFLFDGTTLYAHMARANPHAELLNADVDSMVIFLGPHAYISPSWYADRATAPTWDYVAVHCYGRVRVHSDAEALENIRRLVHTMEGEDGWNVEELPSDDVNRMIRNIVSFEIPVARLDAKWKLNQGEKPERTRAAVERLEARGDTEIAEFIRRYNSL
jgi:transcriptional regulator